MSLFDASEISVTAKEGQREGNKRVIDRVELEIADSVPTQQFDGTGRSDWFCGVCHSLTITQAESLHEKLGKQLEYLKELEAQERIVLKRS